MVVMLLTPRGLGRADAARYIGVGARLFDAMVADGRMPKPIRINARVLWDRHAVDLSFDALCDAGGIEAASGEEVDPFAFMDE